ncbi:MAG: hypothetical protein JJT78_02815 [Leptospira sp.]|nr:hypothetical protein [Leptospira sp.]
MKANTLDLFWVEKIKLIQYSINLLKSLSDKDLDKSSNSSSRPNETIRDSIDRLIWIDRKLSTNLPFSIKMSRFFPFSLVDSASIEKELLDIRDMIDAPALPPELSGIIARKVEDLEWQGGNSSLDVKWKEWISYLTRIEKELFYLEESAVLKLRYFSWKGIFSIPSAINLSAAQSHCILRECILKNLNSQ